MADVTILYKGSNIVELNDSATKTLFTQGKYCEDNITIDYVKPSGGVEGQTLDDCISRQLYGIIKTNAPKIGDYAIYLNSYNTTDKWLDSLIAYEATELGVYGMGQNYSASVSKPILKTIVFCKLQKIDAAAFLGNRETQNIVILTPTVCALTNANAFSQVGTSFGGYKVYVPQNLLSTYQSATNWSSISNNIVSIEDNRTLLEAEFQRIGFEYDWGN